MKQEYKNAIKYPFQKAWTEQDAIEVQQTRKIQTQLNQMHNNNTITTLLKLRLINIKQQRKQPKIILALLNDYKNKNTIIDIQAQVNKPYSSNLTVTTKQKQGLRITKIKQIKGKKSAHHISKQTSTACTSRKQQCSNLNNENILKSKQKYGRIQIGENTNQKLIEKLKIYQATPLYNSTATYIHSHSQAKNKRNYYSCLDKCRIATENYDQLKVQVTNKVYNNNIPPNKLLNRSVVISQNNQLFMKNKQKISKISNECLCINRKKDKENKFSSLHFIQKIQTNLLGAQEIGWNKRRNNQRYKRRGYRNSCNSYNEQYYHSSQNKSYKGTQLSASKDQQEQNWNKKSKRYMQVSVADFMQEDESNISESISKKFEQLRKFNSGRQNSYQKSNSNRDNSLIEYEIKARQKIQGFNYNLNYQNQIQPKFNKINLSEIPSQIGE